MQMWVTSVVTAHPSCLLVIPCLAVQEVFLKGNLEDAQMEGEYVMACSDCAVGFDKIPFSVSALPSHLVHSLQFDKFLYGEIY